MKSSLGISNFLEEISSLSHSSVFLLLCIDRWGRLSYLSLLFFGTLHSDACIFPFLLCFSLLFFSQLFVRPLQTAILLFCIFCSLGWSWFLPPVQCHKPLSIVIRHSIRSVPKSISHFQCIVLRDLIQVIPEWSSRFPHFLQFKSEFGNKEFMIWATVCSWSCFCWLYRASPSLASKI